MCIAFSMRVPAIRPPECPSGLVYKVQTPPVHRRSGQPSFHCRGVAGVQGCQIIVQGLQHLAGPSRPVIKDHASLLSRILPNGSLPLRCLMRRKRLPQGGLITAAVQGQQRRHPRPPDSAASTRCAPHGQAIWMLRLLLFALTDGDWCRAVCTQGAPRRGRPVDGARAWASAAATAAASCRRAKRHRPSMRRTTHTRRCSANPVTLAPPATTSHSTPWCPFPTCTREWNSPAVQIFSACPDC